MRISGCLLCLLALVHPAGHAEGPARSAPKKDAAAPAPARTETLTLLGKLVRIGDDRYSSAAGAIDRLRQTRVDTVNILVCPHTFREDVNRLVDALVAAQIIVRNARQLGGKALECADNARVTPHLSS
jgi:hypothetical protein